MSQIEDLKLKIIRLEGSLEEKLTRLQDLMTQKEEIDLKLPSKQEAILLAKKCLETSLEQKKYIEEIVSAGLTEVFGTTYTFILETVYGPDGSIKGLKPRLKESNGEFDDPINSFGAGVGSIASACFRMAILLLSSGTAKVLILDEPLANVSSTLQDRFKVFVETICEQTGLQLIMITHMDAPFGRVWEVTKESKIKNKSSKIKDVTEVIGDN